MFVVYDAQTNKILLCTQWPTLLGLLVSDGFIVKCLSESEVRRFYYLGEYGSGDIYEEI